MHYHLHKLIFASIVAIATVAMPSYANSTKSIQNLAFGGIDSQLDVAKTVAAKTDDIKTAVGNYYKQNSAFPANLTDIITDGFYFGNLSTPYGTDFSGSASGSTYKITLNTESEKVAKYIAGKTNGSSTNNTIDVGITTADLITNGLQTDYDPSGVANTMKTDILMDGNNIVNINNIDAATINASNFIYEQGARVFSPNNKPTKADVGLDLIENYQISDNYLSGSSTTYASQKAVTDAYSALDALKLNISDKATDSEKLDGLSSAAFARSTTTINGKPLSSNVTITKADVDLANVQNFNVTDSFALNSSNLYASAKSVNDAYNLLNTNKLEANATAIDSDKLDGLDSTDFALSSRTINGFALNNNITLGKTHVGLSNVQNFGISNSYGLNNASSYASSKAVFDAYNALNTNKLGVNAKASDADLLDGLNSSDFALSSRIINGFPLTSNITLGKTHIGLSNVENFGISNSYGLNNASSYASSKAIFDAYNALNTNKLGINAKATDADLLDGLNSSDFALSSRIINGFPLTSNITLGKTHIGLSNVENFGISNSYGLNNASSYASSKAVFDAYNALNTNKLGINAKATDADLLDGLNSSAFALSSRTINGLPLTSNVTLTKAHVNLSNVEDFGISNSYGLNNASSYASSKAVFDAYNALNANKLGVNAKATDADKLDGYDSSAFAIKSASNTFTADQAITKNNPWLTLDSASTGGAGTDQGAGISIGESGKKGSAALHLTYTGDGYSHIGMGSVNGTSGLPAYEAIRLYYTSNNTNLLGDAIVDGTLHANNGLVVDGKTIVANGGTTIYENNVALSAKYLGINDQAADANLLRGLAPSSASTANTIVTRNGSGDINARLFRSEYDSTNASIGYIMTQVDTTSNNYIRPSTPAQFRAAVTDGYYVPTTRKINGKALSGDITLTKADVDLGLVQNYGISNSYTLNSATSYASSKAVADAYSALNAAKLNIGAKAADSNNLDGLDSTAFMRSKNIGGYYGLAQPGGGDANWIRTTQQGLLPYSSTNTSNIGTSSWQFNKIYGKDLYENNVLLSDKYLGKSAKATDADKLDGLDSSVFARTDIAETFNSTVTATDFILSTPIGGRDSLQDALTWIKDYTPGTSSSRNKKITVADGSRTLNFCSFDYYNLTESIDNFDEVIVIFQAGPSDERHARSIPSALLGRTTGTSTMVIHHDDSNYTSMYADADGTKLNSTNCAGYIGIYEVYGITY